MNAAEKQQRLKNALWYSTGKTVDHIAIEKGINATPLFIGGLSEMLWAQIGTVHTSVARRASPDIDLQRQQLVISRTLRNMLVDPPFVWRISCSWQGAMKACKTS